MGKGQKKATGKRIVGKKKKGRGGMVDSDVGRGGKRGGKRGGRRGGKRREKKSQRMSARILNSSAQFGEVTEEDMFESTCLDFDEKLSNPTPVRQNKQSSQMISFDDRLELPQHSGICILSNLAIPIVIIQTLCFI